MRPGLVAVGGAFAAVGIAVIVVGIMPVTSPPLTRTGTAAVSDLAGGDTRSFYLVATSVSSAEMAVNWTATSAMVVSWYATTACSTPPNWCAVSPALDSWTNVRSGRWSASGDAGSRYLLYVETEPPAGGAPATSANFSATFTEHYQILSRVALSVPFLLTMSAGGLLAGVGAVALYLGLFLPSGVYGDELDDEFGPDDEAGTPPAGPSGAPPRPPNPPP